MRGLSRLLGFLAVMLLALPFGAVLVGSAAELAAGGAPMPGSQGMALLLKTLQLCGAVALLTGILVLIGGYTLHMTPQGRALMKWLYPLMLITLLVPYPVHGLVWLRIFKAMGIGFAENGAAAFGVVWVQLMTFIPLGFIIGTLGYRTIARELIDAASVFSPPGYSRLIAVLPMAVPGVLAAMLAVFVLSAGDYGIPSLFGVTVYPMYLQTLFSAGVRPGPVLLGALPLVLVTMLCWSAAWRFSVRYTVAAVPAPPSPAPEDRSLTAAFGYLLALTACLSPAAALSGALTAPGAWASLGPELLRSGAGVANSLWYSALAGGGAWLLVRALFQAIPVRRGAIGVPLLLTLPLAVPANITAIAVLYLFRSLPFGAPWLDPALLVLALMTRYLPLAILITLLFLNQIPQAQLDAAAVFARTPWEARSMVLVPLLQKAMLLGGFAVLVMAGGDTGIYILLAPPGSETISVKIYNYLHYGANDTALAMSLVYGLTFMVPFLLWTRGKLLWGRAQDDQTP